jgi:excinuclease ABC subunit C
VGEPGEGSATNSPEDRAAHALAALEKKAGKTNDLALLSDHLSLLRRWFYRPEKQRTGEIFLPSDDGGWPVRRILRGAARMVLGEPKALPDVQREAAKKVKTRILHEGRPDVERTIPVLPKSRRSKTVADSEGEEPIADKPN